MNIVARRIGSQILSYCVSLLDVCLFLIEVLLSSTFREGSRVLFSGYIVARNASWILSPKRRSLFIAHIF